MGRQSLENNGSARSNQINTVGFNAVVAHIFLTTE
jgi:hypothetical protein